MLSNGLSAPADDLHVAQELVRRKPISQHNNVCLNDTFRSANSSWHNLQDSCVR